MGSKTDVQMSGVHHGQKTRKVMYRRGEVSRRGGVLGCGVHLYIGLGVSTPKNGEKQRKREMFNFFPYSRYTFVERLSTYLVVR